ncbi:hypothetical protein L1887_55223 [Cichorium endivia]|nr:hypothetical protein L1887_55223 [Cichorium endivia]
MSSEAVCRDAAPKPNPNAGERAAAGGAVRIRQSAPDGSKTHLSSSLDCKASSALPLEVGSPHCAVPPLDAERGRRGVGLSLPYRVSAMAFHRVTRFGRGNPNFTLLLAWRFPSFVTAANTDHQLLTLSSSFDHPFRIGPALDSLLAQRWPCNSSLHRLHRLLRHLLHPSPSLPPARINRVLMAPTAWRAICRRRSSTWTSLRSCSRWTTRTTASSPRASCGTTLTRPRRRLTRWTLRSRHRTSASYRRSATFSRAPRRRWGVIKVRDSCEHMQHYGKCHGEDGMSELTKDEALKKLTITLRDVKVQYKEAAKALKAFYDEEDEQEDTHDDAQAQPEPASADEPTQQKVDPVTEETAESSPAQVAAEASEAAKASKAEDSS